MPPIKENLPLEPLVKKPVVKPNSPPLQSKKKVLHSPPFIEIKNKPAIINYQPIKETISKPPKPTTENFSPLIIKKEGKLSKTGKNFSFVNKEIFSGREKFLEQLPVINHKNQPSENEKLLLAERQSLILALQSKDNEIQSLKEQLAQVKTKNQNLTAKLNQAQALIQTEKQRAKDYEKQLKIVAKVFYYKQLEQQAKIEYPLTFKPKNG